MVSSGYDLLELEFTFPTDLLLKDGKEIDSEKVFMGGEYMFVEIQNKCIFPRLSKKFCDFNKLSLYLTMYTMEEGKIWIEDDMKEILKIIKEGKYYIPMADWLSYTESLRLTYVQSLQDCMAGTITPEEAASRLDDKLAEVSAE